jgi:hypothetical protein
MSNPLQTPFQVQISKEPKLTLRKRRVRSRLSSKLQSKVAVQANEEDNLEKAPITNTIPSKVKNRGFQNQFKKREYLVMIERVPYRLKGERKVRGGILRSKRA